jgi:hypothetical protein
MNSIAFKCPVTGLEVREFIASEDAELDVYVPVRCPACRQIHQFNPVNNKVLWINVPR